MRIVDNLALLLPSSPAPYVDHARRVATFLRLVRDDSKAARAAAVRVSLDGARAELEEHGRRRLHAALVDLARRHFYAELGPDSFVWCGDLERELQQGWSEIESLRDEVDGLPATPAPNEPALEVCERLLESARRFGMTAADADLWRARLIRARAGAAEGERAFEALFRALRGEGRVQAICGAVECALDRGAVRAARRRLDEHAGELVGNLRAARLNVWCTLLLEEEAAARALEARAEIWSGRLPRPLAELRAALPSWIPFLSGRLPPEVETAYAHTSQRSQKSSPSHGASDSDASLSAAAVRRDLGAVAVARYELHPGRDLEPLELDVAPALRERVREWRRGLANACADPLAIEHRVIVEARPILAHRAPGAPLRDVLSSAHVQCVAAAPYFDERGEVAGWLRIEWEHHLAPTAAALTELAARFARRGRTVGSARGNGAAGSVASEGPRIEWELGADDADGPCAQAFFELVDGLGMKTAQRRWWAFEVGPSHVRLAAEGGGPRADVGAVGERRGVLRALRSGAPVRFDEPRPELALRVDSASGVVLPVRRRGVVCGLLAVESSRRRDFSDALVRRWCERADAFGLQLGVAQFREWHRARFGHDVYFGHGPSAWIEPLAIAARSRAPIALFGSNGSGRTIVARWLHFESAQRDGELREVVVAQGGRTPEREAIDLRGAATVVIDGVERLDELRQQELIAAFDRAARSAPAESPSKSDAVPSSAAEPRWIVTGSTRLSDSVHTAALRADLRSRLERLQLRVPDLAQRRTEIAGLLHVLARRFAAEESLEPPTFEDDAIALLWRQPWTFNVRELENVVFKLVLMAPGASLRADDVEQLARRFQIEFLRRVPSRKPDPRLVRDALISTINQRGTLNKTRASLYLGWDPDTLVARMTDLGIDESNLWRGDFEPRSPAAGEETEEGR